MPSTAPSTDPWPVLGSDEEIVDRVRGGETCLFETLMRRHNERLYRALRGILRDDAEIEDVMQDAYLAAFTNLCQLQESSRFTAWLLRIARNAALRRVRHARAVVATDLWSETGTPRDGGNLLPEEAASFGQAINVLERAIDALPEPHREVVMLRAVQGLSMQDTAEILEISEEAVRVRLHRARALLKSQVQERVGADAMPLFPFFAPRCNRVVAGVLARLWVPPHVRAAAG